MVGTFHHVHVVFNHENGVALLDEGIEARQQAADVVEMETRGRLVQDEERGGAVLEREIVGQFHALVFAARECAGGLSQFDISEADILERLQASHDALLAVLAKKFYGAVHCHVQDIANILSLVAHFEDVAFEALASTRLALQHKIGHKLHFHLDRSFAFAFLAAAARRIETEVGGRISHLFGQGLVGHEFANLVVGFHIGGRIRAAGLANGILVHKLHVLHRAEVAFEGCIFAGAVADLVQMAFEGAVKDVAHQGALARTTYACHHGQHIEGETHVHAFQVVGSGTADDDAAVPGAATRRHGDAVRTRQVLEGMRAGGCLALDGLLDMRGLALPDHFATVATCFGPYVHDVVGCPHNVLVVLHHDDRIAEVAEFAEHADESLGVARVQADTGLVEDIETADQRTA